jgi:hypothetical protein
MPYIKEDRRENLDKYIDELVNALWFNVFRDSYDEISNNKIQYNLSNEQFLSIVGDINYCVSRIVSSLMCMPSYAKIAMITGVLENIKQEFYRRVASNLEDGKIIGNGDIKEYKRLK